MRCRNYYIETMNTDYQTSISVAYGYKVNAQQPIITFTQSLQNAKCAEPHAHPRAQLIACNRGIMEVVTPDEIWIVNPSQAVWIPGFAQHQVYFPRQVEVFSAFIDPSFSYRLPKESFAFDLSDFTRSLLNKVTSFANPTQFTAAQGRVFDVLLDELAAIVPSLVFLPTSADERVKKVTDALMDDLSSKYSIDYYAEQSCVSSRTLSRLFTKELGMSFGTWRIRLKMIAAIRQLEEGLTIKEIAFNLGYENTSSFIATFKKYFQKTPGEYKSLSLTPEQR